MPLRQDLTHGVLLQFHLIFWIILKPSCLTNGFFRLFHYTCSTPCFLEPSLPHFFKLPVFIIPLDPHIPGFSSLTSFSYYTSSLQSQSKVPDNQFLSWCVSTEELLSSFNTQDQTPDDSSTHDCQCAPRDFFVTSLQFRQVISSSDTSSHTTYKTTGFIVKEFDDNWVEFSSASDVVNWTPSTGYLARLPTKDNTVNLINGIIDDKLHVP